MDRKKIVLFVGDNLSAHVIANNLVSELIDRELEAIVFITSNSDSPKAHQPQLLDYAFYESHLLNGTCYLFLESRVPLTKPDGKPLRELSYCPKHLKELYGINTEYVSDVNGSALLDKIISDDKIMGAVSVRNYQIFKPEIIKVFQEKGFLWNLHMGLLPAYRGVYIPLRAMENGEQEYGWSLHHVDKGIDTGSIICSATQPLNPRQSLMDIYFGLIPHGVQMIMSNLDMVLAGNQPAGKPQDHNDGRYYTFPTQEELKRFDQKGFRLVNPSTVPDIYASLFSIPGTQHASLLRENLISAIADWEQGKKHDVNPEIVFSNSLRLG